jgi:hypothetical protein
VLTAAVDDGDGYLVFRSSDLQVMTQRSAQPRWPSSSVIAIVADDGDAVWPHHHDKQNQDQMLNSLSISFSN